ncbi:MAG: aldehyde dehydrogenase (NADP(+)) [Bryobacteraceae bacterium]
MEIHGKNFLGSELSSLGEKTFRAYDPQAGRAIDPEFHEATQDEVNRALDLADRAAVEIRRLEAGRISDFLAAVREEILALGDQLIGKAAQETALDSERLKGERGRTLNQIGLFIDIVNEGSWVDARIDPALPDRKPLPRPDIRRMLQPIGPVAVFGASNFPLAFSVAGGDTISAFAAKNPVIVKAHPAHPGTSALVAGAIVRAVKSASMPEGTFSMLHGMDPAVSLALATHPKTRAVAFTGSERAGRALFDAAARRPDPIPVFAEMGSVNPVFILPGALKSEGEKIADGLFRSVLLGVGQFCTSPGLVFTTDADAFPTFRKNLVERFEQASPGTMLNAAIGKGYSEKLQKVAAIQGVQSHLSSHASSPDRAEGRPAVLITDSDTWLGKKELHEEIFGPATILVRCASQVELLLIANSLEGTLTATIHGTPDELADHRELIEILSRKAGRLVFNGFPTGVEVGYAMHHGGPYPATTDEKFTSVGAAAIYRFARPVCYQNFPQHLLPPELQNANPRNIWRMIDGQISRGTID